MMESSTLECGFSPAVETFTIDCGHIPVSVSVSCFLGASGVNEFHLAVGPLEPGPAAEQLDWVLEGYESALEILRLDTRSAVLRRFFCSDLSNQRVTLQSRPLSNPRNLDEPCAVSWVGQPPLPPRKIALWAYHMEVPDHGLDKTVEDGTLSIRRGNLAHHWTSGIIAPEAGAADEQTRAVLEAYTAGLGARHMTLADHVVRTWLFVRDVDADYGMLVKARRDFFAAHGLRSDTHFIASTGVQGLHVNAATKVTLDAYAISGLRRDQISYLSAPEHLSPTQVYGVTFERGTSIAYRDRKHVILSGTASIDAEGRIVHAGNVSRQFDRTVENLSALLRAAGASPNDLTSLIAYVRDPADHALVHRRMSEYFDEVPMQVVIAPVCRPGWLVEIEGLGIVPDSRPDLPPF